MSRPTAPDATLRNLARTHGVSTEYVTDRGDRVSVAADTLVAVLAACGVDASTPGAARRAVEARRAADADRLLPPCVVVRAGSPPRLRLPPGTEARVVVEGGGERAPGEPLPPGAHVLHAVAGRRRASAPLLAVPERIPVPERRDWGFLIQLYSVLSRRSWGMGDLADLAELASWSGRALGAGFVQLGPLHAVEPGPLPDPSPYRPSSRRFADPMHVRVEEVPEFRYLDREARRAVDSCADRARALNERVLSGGTPIDRETVRALKFEALRHVYRVPAPPGRRAALEAFAAREGGDLTDFATWSAPAEVHTPTRARDPRPAASRWGGLPRSALRWCPRRASRGGVAPHVRE